MNRADSSILEPDYDMSRGSPMRYVLLIYQAEEVGENLSAAERKKAVAVHRKMQAKAKANGAFILTSQLMPSSAATTVRARRGKLTILDGPFAETKELLVGFYILDCKTLDEAIAYAQSLPHLDTGCIEIRPVAYYDEQAKQ